MSEWYKSLAGSLEWQKNCETAWELQLSNDNQRYHHTQILNTVYTWLCVLCSMAGASLYCWENHLNSPAQPLHSIMDMSGSVTFNSMPPVYTDLGYNSHSRSYDPIPGRQDSWQEKGKKGFKEPQTEWQLVSSESSLLSILQNPF